MPFLIRARTVASEFKLGKIAIKYYNIHDTLYDVLLFCFLKNASDLEISFHARTGPMHPWPWDVHDCSIGTRAAAAGGGNGCGRRGAAREHCQPQPRSLGASLSPPRWAAQPEARGANAEAARRR